MSAQSSYIAPLAAKNDALEVVGGKGRSPARLAKAGFNVTGGFQVTTAAYQALAGERRC